MKEKLYDYLISNSSEIGAFKAFEILFVALIISLIIFVTYKTTYSGVMYNKKFNVSLVMMVLITSMVMIVIGSNIALSLGMVGALSIVRFRTAVKDPRDTMYIFWAISTGICVGTQSYVIAIVGALFLSVIIFLISIGGLGKEDRYILIIRGIREKEEDMMSCVFKAFKSGQLRAKNSTGNNIELVYQIKIKKDDDRGLLKELYAIEGVSAVNIVAQNGETLG
ncbi:DUF4956 domain-containing protein [Clostridium perfringens]|uniref:DUF4956 domain-containing protein n=3 Tax=Clostridium perfringens TaxID=1502 RepID=A0AAW4IYL0_CLOPF|nr:DUF4956 domain-containing protein [Clostridium perfringens]WEV16462.1 DUF4956 domain-containing protein [Clostridium perfringens D]EDT70158.1 tubulin/FtsZ, GTPase [Clostridium perfringens D str. JGS1721]EHA1006073.1 DUF4956 domain-containing protein [Clostridium perfringens]EHA1009055.1 DUF4956 domain-containing protein [Clostridium perfringens]EHA1021366.1 DUF4956 domain-containing protein [Clostridium perfringens]